MLTTAIFSSYFTFDIENEEIVDDGAEFVELISDVVEVEEEGEA